MNNDNAVGSGDTPVRKHSTSNRFEIEKVEETQLNVLNSSYKKNLDNMNESLFEEKETKKSQANPSALKKTVTHYLHDDDFFDLDSHQNTVKDQKQSEREPLTGHTTKKPEPEDDANHGCFQINYNERNQAQSITCNLSASGIDSYRYCIHDFKTVALYQKLIAEFIGTCLLTLYACSIGLPIAEENVPSINGLYNFN